MKHRAVIGFVSAAAALTLATAACSSSTKSNSATSTTVKAPATPYKIAYPVDLTGAVAQTAGLPARAGFMGAVAYINSQGGVNGHLLDVNVIDTQTSTTATVSAFEQAVSGGYMAMSAEELGSEIAAANSIISTAQIPIVATATDPTFTNEPFWYSIAPPNTAQASTAVDAAKQLLGSLTGKRVALAIISDPNGDTVVNLIKSQVAAQGGSVVAVQRDPVTTTSFTSQATTIAASHPDVVLSFNAAPVQLIEHQALVAAGLAKQPLIAMLQTYSPAVLASAKIPNSYAILTSTPPDGSSLPEVWATKAGFGNVNFGSAFLAQGWDAAFVLAQVLGKCAPNCSATAFQAAAVNATFTIPGDLLLTSPSFSQSSHYGVHAGALYHWDATSQAVVKTGTLIQFP